MGGQLLTFSVNMIMVKQKQTANMITIFNSLAGDGVPVSVACDHGAFIISNQEWSYLGMVLMIIRKYHLM